MLKLDRNLKVSDFYGFKTIIVFLIIMSIQENYNIETNNRARIFYQI